MQRPHQQSNAAAGARETALAAARWRVFTDVADDLGTAAFTARDFPNRVQRALAARRQFGARDRRIYRELLFARCRAEPWASALEPHYPGAALQLAALLADSEAEFAVAAGLEASWVARVRAADWDQRLRLLAERWPLAAPTTAALAPAWFAAECARAAAVTAPQRLWSRPPVWLRLQTSDTRQRDAALGELARAGAPCEPSGVLPEAWRTDARIDLTKLSCFANGRVELQDLGSQLILAVAAPRPGERWLDACAGAGGKTLQLALAVGRTGSVAAEDPRGAALGELVTRARRAGLQPLPTPRTIAAAPEHWSPAAQYDGVLVDAPCSGSGTWRRHPHLRLSTTEAAVDALAAVQRALLTSRAAAVRPGGRLVYATCSLAARENEAVVEAFLSQTRDFRDATPATAHGFERGRFGMTLWPDRYDTDGFFVAVLERATEAG